MFAVNMVALVFFTFDTSINNSLIDLVVTRLVNIFESGKRKLSRQIIDCQSIYVAGFTSKPFSDLCLYKWKETDVSATLQQFKATGGRFLRRFCGICAVFCGSRRTALIQATTS